MESVLTSGWLQSLYASIQEYSLNCDRVPDMTWGFGLTGFKDIGFQVWGIGLPGFTSGLGLTSYDSLCK